MQVLKQFSIPLKGLKIGHHDLAYNVDKTFFEAFEHSPFTDGNIDTKLVLEKKSDHMIVQMEFYGTVLTDCDRCTDAIHFPLEGDYEMIIKFDADEREEEEVVYIHPDSPDYNCSKLIYDAIMLALPMNKTCDEVEDKECDPDVISRLDRAPEETNEEGNALAEALKNLKL